MPLGASKVINATINNANNYIYSWSPNTFLNAPNILQPTTNATNEILYTVKAIDVSNNCIGIDSVRVKPITNIYVPNAFTPNAIGKNDTWKIPALEGYPNCSVIIFNRYGQKISKPQKGMQSHGMVLLKDYNNQWVLMFILLILVITLQRQ